MDPMDSVTPEVRAAAMAIPQPAAEQLAKDINGLIEMMERSEDWVRLLVEQMTTLQDLCSAFPNNKSQAEEEIERKLDVAMTDRRYCTQWHDEHLATKPSDDEPANAKLSWCLEQWRLLRECHESDARLVAVLEKGWIEYDYPISFVELRTKMADVRFQMLANSRAAIEATPALTVYLLGFYWNPKVRMSYPLPEDDDQEEANKVAAREDDHANCPICRTPLAEDHEEEQPLDGMVFTHPAPQLTLCYFCEHAFHSFCAMEWFAQRNQEFVDACPLCREPMENWPIHKAFHHVANRKQAMCEQLAIAMGKSPEG